MHDIERIEIEEILGLVWQTVYAITSDLCVYYEQKITIQASI